MCKVFYFVHKCNIKSFSLSGVGGRGRRPHFEKKWKYIIYFQSLYLDVRTRLIVFCIYLNIVLTISFYFQIIFSQFPLWRWHWQTSHCSSSLSPSLPSTWPTDCTGTVWSTLIGPDPTLLRSHWSRSYITALSLVKGLLCDACTSNPML